VAVNTLGYLLALYATLADAQDGAQVAELARQVQAVTHAHVQLAFVGQGYTGQQPAEAAAVHGIRLEVVKLAEAKRGFVLLPRRWVVERSFAWKMRFRRLVRDYERRLAVLAGVHFVAFACLELHRAAPRARRTKANGVQRLRDSVVQFARDASTFLEHRGLGAACAMNRLPDARSRMAAGRLG
jgi:transposase